MTRATKAGKARLLNAAYRLLGQQTEVAAAAQQLAQEFALSRRQAYRYLEQAAALSAPVPTVQPTVVVTFKVPVSIVRGLHADGGDLRTGLLGAAARSTHDCEPDHGADRVGEDARSRGAEGLDLRRRGL